MCMCACLNCSLDPLLIHCVSICHVCSLFCLSLEGEQSVERVTQCTKYTPEWSSSWAELSRGERWRTVTPRDEAKHRIGEMGEWVKSFDGVCVVVVHPLYMWTWAVCMLLCWRCFQRLSRFILPSFVIHRVHRVVFCSFFLCFAMRSHEAFNPYLHSSLSLYTLNGLQCTQYTHIQTPQFANSHLEILRSFQFSFIVCGLFFALFSHSLQNTLAHKPFISPRVRFRFIVSFGCV